MKKLLILILIILIFALTVFTVVKGFDIASIKVLGINQIQQKDMELGNKVEEATKLANFDFEAKKDEISASVKELEKQKTKYEDMVSVSSSEEIQNARQIPKYKVEFLWTTIGTHATREGVVIKMDITNGTGGTDTYNLNFTATGTYVGISEFITDIEDDSSLGFKIEEFSMQQGANVDENQLVASFVCKNVTIENILKTTTNSAENNQNNANGTNTTNTTNTERNRPTNTTDITENTQKYNPVDTQTYNKVNEMMDNENV